MVLQGREKTYWLHEFALYPSKGFGPQAQSKFVERKDHQRARRLTFGRDGRALPAIGCPRLRPTDLHPSVGNALCATRSATLKSTDAFSTSPIS